MSQENAEPQPEPHASGHPSPDTDAWSRPSEHPLRASHYTHTPQPAPQPTPQPAPGRPLPYDVSLEHISGVIEEDRRALQHHEIVPPVLLPPRHDPASFWKPFLFLFGFLGLIVLVIGFIALFGEGLGLAGFLGYLIVFVPGCALVSAVYALIHKLVQDAGRRRQAANYRRGMTPAALELFEGHNRAVDEQKATGRAPEWYAGFLQQVDDQTRPSREAQRRVYG